MRVAQRPPLDYRPSGPWEVPPGKPTMEPPLPLELKVPGRHSGRRQHALFEQLREAIVAGRLAAGLKLPSSRALAVRLRLSRNTVLGAYERLSAEGYVESRRGAGSYVASGVRRPSARRPGRRALLAGALNLERWRAVERGGHERSEFVAARISFRVGVPDWREFPGHLWRRLLSRVIASASGLRPDYAAAAGSEHLREMIARHISRSRAVGCDARDVIVTSGAQQAFDLLARVLIARPGITVAVEDPGYPSLRAPFIAAGARLMPTP